MTRHANTRRLTLLAVAATVLACSTTLAAAPYQPTDDSVVLEKLPVALFSGLDELTTLRRRLAADPTDIQLATEVASRCVRLGKQGGEPRFYGYARAALSPWWTSDDAPPPMLALRAKLKERDHRYDGALADLGLLVKRAPDDVQAWVEIANINRVMGDYTTAWKASDRIAELVGETPALIARAPLMTATGRSSEAHAALEKLAPIAKQRWPEAVDWMLTMRAEVARALGLDEEAERHFQAGLSRSPSNQYLLRSYADLLLDQQRAQEVVTLLSTHTNDTGILLRAAIAARRLGDGPRESRWRAQLEQRFKEIRLRGDRPHGRFESRYWLELKGDPQQALDVGLENWRKQKEPRDTRNVLEAAVAARVSSDAVQPVLDFMATHRVDHATLLKLATEVRASR